MGDRASIPIAKPLSAVVENIIPATDDTYDLGSPDKNWAWIYAAMAVIGSIAIGGVVGLSNVDGVLHINASTQVNGSFNVLEDLTVFGNTLLHGNLTVLGDESELNLTILNVNSSIKPHINNSFDLGDESRNWKDIYLSGEIHIAGTQANLWLNNQTTGAINIITETLGSYASSASINASFIEELGSYVSSAGVNNSYLRLTGGTLSDELRIAMADPDNFQFFENLDSGDDFAFRYPDSASSSSFLLVPYPQGSANFSSEFGFSFDDNNWFIDNDFVVDSGTLFVNTATNEVEMDGSLTVDGTFRFISQGSVLGDTTFGDNVGDPKIVVQPSISTPAYTFRNDVDTGIYRAGTNSLGFSTGGFSRLIIDSSGDVYVDGDANFTGEVVVSGRRQIAGSIYSLGWFENPGGTTDGVFLGVDTSGRNAGIIAPTSDDTAVDIYTRWGGNFNRIVSVTDSTLMVGNGSTQVNITMTSPNGGEFSCGINNAGTFECT
tara:strand:+ start:2188 stop:3663 length:1476 start_codon:yes stop_codon:yes gene_type:complete